MLVRAPSTIETPRLILRRPVDADVPRIFGRYASDPVVTRFVGWPRHETLADTDGFLAFSDAEWDRWPAGPYLIEAREDGVLLGSTGLGFETSFRAATGYVLAADAWGRGYATEALRAMATLAPALGVVRLHAICHAEHRASARVLEKCGFDLEGTLRRHTVFPNLPAESAQDVLCYARTWAVGGELAAE